MADKSYFGREYNKNGRVVDPGILNETIIIINN